eukprot:scaffold5742_cov95-Isochrysis_galbana.AAC.5
MTCKASQGTTAGRGTPTSATCYDCALRDDIFFRSSSRSSHKMYARKKKGGTRYSLPATRRITACRLSAPILSAVRSLFPLFLRLRGEMEREQTKSKGKVHLALMLILDLGGTEKPQDKARVRGGTGSRTSSQYDIIARAPTHARHMLPHGIRRRCAVAAGRSGWCRACGLGRACGAQSRAGSCAWCVVCRGSMSVWCVVRVLVLKRRYARRKRRARGITCCARRNAGIEHRSPALAPRNAQCLCS